MAPGEQRDVGAAGVGFGASAGRQADREADRDRNRGGSSQTQADRLGIQTVALPQNLYLQWTMELLATMISDAWLPSFSTRNEQAEGFTFKLGGTNP